MQHAMFCLYFNGRNTTIVFAQCSEDHFMQSHICKERTNKTYDMQLSMSPKQMCEAVRLPSIPKKEREEGK